MEKEEWEKLPAGNYFSLIGDSNFVYQSFFSFKEHDVSLKECYFRPLNKKYQAVLLYPQYLSLLFRYEVLQSSIHPKALVNNITIYFIGDSIESP